MPQDGYTNPPGTKWIRNEREKPKDDFPDPKKQKMEPAKNNNQSSEAGPSKIANTSKGEGVSGDGPQQKEN